MKFSLSELRHCPEPRRPLPSTLSQNPANSPPHAIANNRPRTSPNFAVQLSDREPCFLTKPFPQQEDLNFADVSLRVAPRFHPNPPCPSTDEQQTSNRFPSIHSAVKHTVSHLLTRLTTPTSTFLSPELRRRNPIQLIITSSLRTPPPTLSPTYHQHLPND